MNKPTKPNIVIPESFAENGIKTDFDNEKLTNGFDRLQPDVLAGDNLNKLIDDTYKGLNYAIKYADFIGNLQFNNIAEMKENEELKNGQLIITLGYYSMNDGGQGLYKIREKTENDIDDGGSLHFLKNNLVAELIFTEKLNGKVFGLYIDGVHDDTETFNKIYDYLIKIKKTFTKYQVYKTSPTLFIPNGIMKISDTIKIDGSIFNVEFDRTIIDAFECQDVAIQVYGNNYPPFSNSQTYIKGFHLIGNNSNGSIGLKIGLDTTDEPSRINIDNFAITRFEKGITFGNHTYLIRFNHGEIYDCIDGLYYPAGLSDSGENIMFYGCVFFGRRLLNINGSNTTLRFVTCSFDYCTQILKATGTNFCSFIDCHFEWNNIETVAFQFDQGFHLSFRGGLMMNTSQESKTSECVFEVLNTTTSHITSGYKITIDNMLLSLPNFKYLIKNDNILVKNTLSWGYVNLPTYQDNLSSNIKGNCNIDTALTTSYANNQLTIQRVHRGQINFSFISKLTKDTNFSVYHTELVTPEQILLPIWKTVGICTFDRDGKIVILYSQGAVNVTPTIQTAIQDSQPTVTIGDMLYCKNLCSWINQYGDNIYHVERYVTSDGEYLFNFVFNNVLFENY